MIRRLSLSMLLAVAALVCCCSVAGAKTPLAIHISGNTFVNGDGQQVQLIGVNQPGTEYACEEGYGFSDTDNATNAKLVKTWGANAVRIPINEDCWLGINGEPWYRQPMTATEARGQAEYQHVIENYVRRLNSEGIYAILDVQWTAPGTYRASGQEPMPDDHTVAFWKSVGTEFKSNPAVAFDVYDEPYSPIFNGLGDVSLSWSCWLNGGCQVDTTQFAKPVLDSNGNYVTYTAVGMQALINAVRSVGADQPLIIEGLQWSQDVSGWLANEPTDTLADPQIAASFHSYQDDGTCDDPTCWDSTVAPIAAQVPVVTGEFNDGNCLPDGQLSYNDWDAQYMSWADAHGISYIAWAWSYNPKPTGCYSYNLLNYNGTPTAGDGVTIRNQMRALATAAGRSLKVTPLYRCVVPKLSGFTLKSARENLKDAHCAVGKIRQAKRTKADAGHTLQVFATSPKPGVRTDVDHRVALRMRFSK